MTVLIIEDDFNDAQRLTEVLRQASLATDIPIARSGMEAIQFLENVSAEAGTPLPRLIFLDLKMPGMDGIQVLTCIKSDPRWKHIPVVIVTGARDLRKVNEAYRLGAATFFIKPLEGEDELLTAFVARSLGPEEAGAAATTTDAPAEFCFPPAR